MPEEGAKPDPVRKREDIPTEVFDGQKYLARVEDLDKPIARDSPMLIQPLRPSPPAPDIIPTKKTPVKVAAVRTKEELDALHQQYYANAAKPATKTIDSFDPNGITEVVEGRAWVVPDILSPQECEDIMKKGEDNGMSHMAIGKTPRTSRRTSNYWAPWISHLVTPRLSNQLLDTLEETVPYSAVRGIHPNWRVASYGVGETFPAHYDQADSMTLAGEEEGTREVCTSSHTLLIYLSPPETFAGGATRLFLSGKYDQDTVDIKLPQGYALVFQQKGMLHAGLDVVRPAGACKYIAQAGLLRAPGQVLGAPSVFKVGPGLDLDYGGRAAQQEMIDKKMKEIKEDERDEI